MKKGEFLHEKMVNMAKWVDAEIGKENLPLDLIRGIEARSVLEVAVFASAMAANKDVATHPNWAGLVRLVQAYKAPQEISEVIVAVQREPRLHEKFWKYINMFIDVSEQ